MQFQEFIFSEEKRYKVTRHFAFWALWWLYFSFCFLLFQQPIQGLGFKPFYLTPGDHVFTKTFLLILLYLLACYPLLYYLFPRFIRGRLLSVAACFILVCTFLFIGTYFLYWDVFTLIGLTNEGQKATNTITWFWPPVNLGLMNFVKVASTAIAIKYLKYWWLKQKENQRLAKDKLLADLKLLKAQIHPDFLFKTLNNIYTHALSSSPRTSGMLLKLSDLLSYMLYECDQPLVELEKEIEMMKEYMQLEKQSYNDEPELEVNVKGDLMSKRIAPFLLLPFIENSFLLGSKNEERFWINLDIQIKEDNFYMKLTNGDSESLSEQSGTGLANGLDKVRTRLSLMYPDRHELKIIKEHEMFIVLLTIRLEIVAGIADNQDLSVTVPGNEESLTNALRYAAS